MKLVRLYADKTFHNIKFSETGLNVVIGCITNKSVQNKDTHNLGKTLLCDLIDFMLLKQIPNKKDFFLTKDERFSDYVFFLEIHLDDNEYVVIRRSAGNPSKVSFRKSSQPLLSFDVSITEWTNDSVPLKSGVALLQKYLSFDVLPEYSYRMCIDYFLRHQADYNDVFHLSKYRDSDAAWKEPLVELLGYDNALLKEKRKIEKTVEDKKNEILFLSNRSSADGDKDSVAALIELKTAELKEKQALADTFDFSNEDTEAHKNLVDTIDVQLQLDNAQEYELERDMEKISRSLNAEIRQIDVDSMKSIFEESKVLFPEEVYIQFQDLLDFNRKISTERNAYLRIQLSDMQRRLPEIKKEIQTYQKRRQEALAFLTETNSYDKYREIQNKITDLQSQILALQSQYDKVSGWQNDIQQLNADIAAQNVRLADIVSGTNTMLTETKHAAIRNYFNRIIKDILNVNGIISLNVNKNGNIDFNAKVQNPDTLGITSKDSGCSYRKLLCIAFDLSLLINYHDKNFFKFAYHDGALEGLDDRKKLAFIAESRNICSQYNLQHIITLIDSDLPRQPDGTVFEFPWEEICLTLSDKDTASKLFAMDF
jgi:uncharacterized protein YydD (DUF2326 family)